jgi:hypothetical protein
VTVIPCEQDPRLRAQIESFAEVLKTQAHQLGSHGLDEASFYSSPIFRGAIEKVRGEFSATMRGKREFVQHVLNHMEDGGFIAGWDRTQGKARNVYYVQLKSGGSAVIDLKGCLDGENTNKFERPTEADEFITWSLCTNSGADPRRNHPQQRGPRERELEIASGRRNSGRCWILIQHLPANTIVAVTGACRARAKSRRCCGADRICDVARRKPDRRQVRVTRITPINSRPPPKRRSGMIGCADVIRNPKWSSSRVVAICPNTTTATVEAAPSRPTLTTTPVR